MKRYNFVVLFLILAIISIVPFYLVSTASDQNEAHPWDANSDGVVDLTDLMFVASHFDSSNPTADVNKDNIVDILDLVLVGQHLGEKYELPKEIIREDGVPMVLIPAGEFQMGDAFNEGNIDERPVHTVYLDAFYMDKYEVTNAQYAHFLNEYGKVTDPAGHTLIYIDNNWCKIIKDGNTYKPMAGYESHPVAYVSWYGAAAYAQHYSKRLPTEAEWEKAARGGLVKKRYVWGDEWPPPRGTGNFADESFKKMYPDLEIISGYDDGYAETAPVGSFNPNGYGLNDMAGNAWEWCADGYDSGYYKISPKNNPKGPGAAVTFTNNDFTNVDTDGVLRGGGWGPDGWFNLRAACRGDSDPTLSYSTGGFRCSSRVTK